jgi:cation:H+ antiporter
VAVTIGLDYGEFVGGAAVSLGTSWLLVSRLERVGERLGLSEALLGMLAALAADTPEVTSAITALLHHQGQVGAGVVMGSNVFNLAALLGVSAVVARHVRLHRKVVVLAGSVAGWVALVCLGVVGGVGGPGVGLALVLAAVVPFAALLGVRRRLLDRLPLPARWCTWLASAIGEEELELEQAIRPRRGRPVDVAVAATALVVVVVASIGMEQSAVSLGRHDGVPGIVVGGIVLAAVTSLPNAVAAVYLARRGRGAATMSTALNSNTLNVLVGLMVPGVVVGLSRPTSSAVLVAAWYVGLTAVSLGLAYAGRGLRRSGGWIVIAGYMAFVASLLAVS